MIAPGDQHLTDIQLDQVGSHFQPKSDWNAINVGLPVIECDTEGIEQDDRLEVDLAGGFVRNLTKGVEVAVAPLPEVMVELLNDGGLVEHFKRYGTFHLRSLD